MSARPGDGMVASMVAMSTLFGVPLALVGGRFARAELALRLGAPLRSLAVRLPLAREPAPGGLACPGTFAATAEIETALPARVARRDAMALAAPYDPPPPRAR